MAQKNQKQKGNKKRVGNNNEKGDKWLVTFTYQKKTLHEQVPVKNDKEIEAIRETLWDTHKKKMGIKKHTDIAFHKAKVGAQANGKASSSEKKKQEAEDNYKPDTPESLLRKFNETAKNIQEHREYGEKMKKDHAEDNKSYNTRMDDLLNKLAELSGLIDNKQLDLWKSQAKAQEQKEKKEEKPTMKKIVVFRTGDVPVMSVTLEDSITDDELKKVIEDGKQKIKDELGVAYENIKEDVKDKIDPRTLLTVRFKDAKDKPLVVKTDIIDEQDIEDRKGEIARTFKIDDPRTIKHEIMSQQKDKK